MARFKILFLIALTILITSCSSTETSSSDLYTEVEATTAKATTSTIEKEVMNAVNDYRVSQGLNVLEFSSIAYDFANSHNDYMISEGQISHDDFNIRSSKLSVQANADYVSENLGKDFTNADDILKAWIASATHKKVMEDQFTHTAVSVKADANGVLYYTQLFFK